MVGAWFRLRLPDISFFLFNGTPATFAIHPQTFLRHAMILARPKTF
jgi:hypothetical protein